MRVQLYNSVIRCDNLGVSKLFYWALGFPLTREKHGNGPVHFSFSPDNLIYELYPARKGQAYPRLFMQFRVLSVNQVLSRLAENFVWINSPDRTAITRQKISKQYTALQATFKDPDGNRIMLVQAKRGIG